MAAASVARVYQTSQTHFISTTLAYNTTGATTGVLVGTLPAGAVLGTCKVYTTTAFNGTVSVALSVGFTLTGTDLINGTDVRTATARVDTFAPIAAVITARAATVDTPIYASIALGGTAGTAGSAIVELTYTPNVG